MLLPLLLLLLQSAEAYISGGCSGSFTSYLKSEASLEEELASDTSTSTSTRSDNDAAVFFVELFLTPSVLFVFPSL